MTVCRVEGCTAHYGCVLRAKGVNVSPEATPSRHNRKSPAPQNNSWERGTAGEYRRDGSFMPYLNEHRERVRVHEFANRRHEIDEQVTRLKQDPSVFRAERTD